MGTNTSTPQIGNQFVIGTKDIEEIKEKQKDHGGWNPSMNECLVGPLKLMEVIGSSAIVRCPSGNLLRLNPELLVKYKSNTSKKHKIGSFVELIQDEDEFKRNQTENGEWNEDMKNLIGKKVELIQKFVDGDYKIKYENKIFTINSKNVIGENKIIPVSVDLKLELGDKVVLIKDVETMKSLQKDHGGWCELMSLFIGEEVDIVSIFEDGDMYVSKFGMEWLINPKCVAGTSKNKIKDDAFKQGDSVQISNDIAKTRQLQISHGGWLAIMTSFAGKTAKIDSFLPSGDVKVCINGTVLVYNPKLLSKIEKPDSKGFVPGSKVRLIKDKEKVKRLQKGHGEWVKSMELFLGKKGKVKLILPDGDLKVKIMSNKLTLNPECVMATDSDSDSDPDLKAVIHQLSKIISVDSDESDKDGDDNDNQINKFFAAIKIGNLIEVSNLVDIVEVNTDLNGEYPLMVAVNNGHEDVAKLLIEKNADLNARDKHGDTALHLAVRKNRFKFCNLLLKKGANVNDQNNNKLTPIMLAAVAGSQDILELLANSTNADLKIGNSNNDTALHLAVQTSKINSVNTLLNAGSNIKILNKRLYSAYHLAALQGQEKIIEMFLKREGASIVDSQKIDKFAAIHLAVFNNHENCLRVLLKYKADINILNEKLQTALHIAVSQKHLNCVKILVESKADLNLKDVDGETPLHVAMRVKIIEEVIQVGHLYGITDMLGLIKTDNEKSYKSDDIVIYLIKNGARKDILNNNNKTPLDLCKDEALKERISNIRDKNFWNKLVINANVPKATAPVVVPVQEPVTVPVPVPVLPVNPVGVSTSFENPASSKLRDKEIEELREIIQRMEEENTCVICRDQPINVTFDCGHRTCNLCADNLFDCHICRKKIENIIKLF